MAAEAVVAFLLSGQEMLLNRVAMLPIDQQREIAAGEPIKVVEMQGDQPTYKMLPAAALDSAEVKQVFDTKAHRIRTEAEQVAYLKPRPAPMLKSKPRLRLDRKKEVLSVGKELVTLDELFAFLLRAGYQVTRPA